jgi:hypothetical protein
VREGNRPIKSLARPERDGERSGEAARERRTNPVRGARSRRPTLTCAWLRKAHASFAFRSQIGAAGQKRHGVRRKRDESATALARFDRGAATDAFL